MEDNGVQLSQNVVATRTKEVKCTTVRCPDLPAHHAGLRLRPRGTVEVYFRVKLVDIDG